MVRLVKVAVGTLAIASHLVSGYTDDDDAYHSYATEATSMFWTVTQYVVSTETYDYLTYTLPDQTQDRATYTTTVTYTDTGMATLKAEYTPAATASILNTTTSTISYNNLELVQIELAPDSLILFSEYVDDSSTGITTVYSSYVFWETYRAPSTCTSVFTWLLDSNVNVPTEVTDQLTPTSTSTSLSTRYRPSPYSATTYTYKYLWVPPSQVPAPSTPAWEYSYYIESCQTPYDGQEYGASSTTTYSDMTFSSLSGSQTGVTDADTARMYIKAQMETNKKSSVFYRLCSSKSYSDDAILQSVLDGTSADLCYEIQPWVIAISVVLPLLLIAGFFESFFWFSRLMTGRKTLRLGTISWMLLCPWVLLYTRKTPAVEDDKHRQKITSDWSAMSFGAKFGHWRKWAFAWEYPTELLGPLNSHLQKEVAVPSANWAVHPEYRKTLGPDGFPLLSDIHPNQNAQMMGNARGMQRGTMPTVTIAGRGQSWGVPPVVIPEGMAMLPSGQIIPLSGGARNRDDEVGVVNSADD